MQRFTFRLTGQEAISLAVIGVPLLEAREKRPGGQPEAGAPRCSVARR